MSNSSLEYWSVNGVSLNQYCWSISTLGGRNMVPPVRGDNVQYAYRPGRDWRAKVPDSQTLSLAMWVAGINPDTDIPSANQIVQWNENWRALKTLFWSPRSQLSLTRRIRYTSGIQTTTALAELVGTMEPTMTGRTRANFVVDLLLADPFFYGGSQTISVPRSTPTVVNNPGDDAVAYRNFSLTFHGPLTNPKLTNSTGDPDVWVKVGAAIATGDTVTVDIGEFTALRASDSANLVGGVTHSGSRTWLGLLPGDNTLTLTSDAGTGTVDVTFAAPYL